MPPLATRPAGFQPIGQNGFRDPASSWNDDLFLSAIATDSSEGLFLAFAGAAFSVGGVFGAGGAVLSLAPNNADASAIDRLIERAKCLIVFRSPWWQQFQPVEIGIRSVRHGC